MIEKEKKNKDIILFGLSKTIKIEKGWYGVVKLEVVDKETESLVNSYKIRIFRNGNIEGEKDIDYI